MRWTGGHPYLTLKFCEEVVRLGLRLPEEVDGLVERSFPAVKADVHFQAVLRFVAAQDVGCAIHPSYVEGQIQGGVVQGIGWALNEEYIYDKNGRLDNAGFLDYRVPVSSDLPMIDAVLVEVPNPGHPYGAKGVGEVNIVPPMAAIANAIDSAIHRRLTELPMSPPRVRAALDHTGADD